MKRRAKGEGSRRREGSYLRWELVVNGRRIVRKAKTKSELERKIEAVKQQLTLVGGICDTVKTLTFDQAFDLWLQMEICEPLVSPRTVESYTSVRRNHLASLARLRLSELQAVQLQRIVNGLHATGKTRTAIYTADIAQRCLNFAKRHKLVAHNIAEDVKRPAYQCPPVRSMNKAELQRVLTEAEQQFAAGKFRHYPILLFLLNTGVRVLEALGISEHAIVENEGVLSIDISHQLIIKDGQWDLRSAKSHSQRLLPLNTKALQALRLAILQREIDRENVGPDYRDNGLLFCQEDGTPYHRSSIHHSFQRFQKAIGVDDPFSVHELRHTMLTHLARTASIQVVASVAGHRSIRTTERYVKALDSDVAEAMLGLELTEDTTPNTTPKSGVEQNSETADRRMGRKSSSNNLERLMGIEPTSPAWKAGALPLSYSRSRRAMVPARLGVKYWAERRGVCSGNLRRGRSQRVLPLAKMRIDHASALSEKEGSLVIHRSSPVLACR